MSTITIVVRESYKLLNKNTGYNAHKNYLFCKKDNLFV